MKKGLFFLAFLVLGMNYLFAQALASQNKSAEVPILSETDKKVFVDTKMKKTLKEKSGILTSHAITFYTSAFYKYVGTGAGGKVGQQYGFLLEGVSDDTFQEIADETGKYLEKKLTEFGYSIDDYNKFLSAKNIDKLKEKSEEPKVEKSVQNPNFTKKVKARTFTQNNRPVYPEVVGNTMYFKAVPSMKTNAVISRFDINFLSFGQKIESSKLFDEGKTTGQMLLESSIHGGASLQILTPSLKYGELSTILKFSHPNKDGFEATGEIKDGFYVLKADEAKYKQYSIELINTYIDLMMDHMASL
ncbi:hypothetical protein HZR84_12130 [Hyphobacterium sp. CCMP332]|nr:hypothetical protein HZR84_12130 [Hyphobacterium sp. CCMP332]